MKSQSKDSTALAAYKQIEDNLRSKIRQGHWPVGAMFPSRRDLAKEYGVSPITVERAVTRLLADGILRADDRRGTFVARLEAAWSASARSTETLPFPLSDEDASAVVVRTQAPPTAAATIGIIASLYLFNHDHLELNNFWVRLLVQSMEQNLSENGHITRFFNRVQGPGRTVLSLKEALQSALDAGVDAVAIIGFGLAPQEVDESLAALEGKNQPVVCITSAELNRPVSHVFLDNRSAGYDAARCVLQSGCRNITYLAPFTTSWVREREEGIRTALEYAGLNAADALRVYPREAKPWIQEEDPQVPGYASAHAFLEEGFVPSGVICANDGVAFGFLQAAGERGLKVGRDFVVVSFDDHSDARHRHLTTLRPPMEAMGQEASTLLLRALRGEQTRMQMRLRWHLIPRASCTPNLFPVSASLPTKEVADRH